MNLKIFIVLSCIGCLSACNFSVTIKQELMLDGFHRNMTYSVSMVGIQDDASEVWPYVGCYISLHQQLPPGIFANSDELKDLTRSQKINAVTKQTNLESSALHADYNMAYIFQKMQDPWVKLWLPLHARHHKAIPNGGFVFNEIAAPELYMRCPGEDHNLEKCYKPKTSIEFLCSAHSRKKCNWKNIPYVLSSETPIIWPTPAGNLNHYNLVAVATTVVIVIGSVYLLSVISETKSQLKYSN